MSEQTACVSKNIKNMIKERGVRIEFVAKKVGVTRTHIYMLMNGTANPSLDVLGKLADFFNVPIADFFKKLNK